MNPLWKYHSKYTHVTFPRREHDFWKLWFTCLTFKYCLITAAFVGLWLLHMMDKFSCWFNNIITVLLWFESYMCYSMFDLLGNSTVRPHNTPVGNNPQQLPVHGHVCICHYHIPPWNGRNGNEMSSLSYTMSWNGGQLGCLYHNVLPWYICIYKYYILPRNGGNCKLFIKL